MVPCVSHLMNLCVQVAFCGKRLKDPIESSALLATCSRFYKYLFNDYYEEFSTNLRDFVVEALTLKPVDSEAQITHNARVACLTALYGDEVLPRSMLNFFALSLEYPCYCCADLSAVNIRELRGEFWRFLQKRVLVVEEHCTLSRFWTFG